MREIRRSSAFKKDYKRVKADPRHRDQIDALLENVVTVLLQDKPLPEKCKDHPLTGNWTGYRDCHLKPDLLLLYAIDEHLLLLARLGSHSELFD